MKYNIGALLCIVPTVILVFIIVFCVYMIKKTGKQVWSDICTGAVGGIVLIAIMIVVYIMKILNFI